MADRYAVNTPFTWNATVGNKWATTSGGAGGASVPTASDNAICDANSGGGTITIGAASTCLDLTCTSAAGDFTGTIAGASTLAVSGSITLEAAMAGFTYTGVITLNATSAKTITSGGKSFGGNITMNGVAGSWTLQDTFVSTAANVTLTNGTFDTNAKTVTMGQFLSTNNNIRTVTITNSTIHLTGGGGVNPWNFTLTGGLTFNSSGSTISFENPTASTWSFNTGGQTFNDIAMAGAGSGTLNFAGPNCVFRDLAISNAAAAILGLNVTMSLRTLNFTGYNGSWNGTGQLSISGDLTLGAGMTVGSTGNLFFVATSGTQTITSNGVPFSTNLIRQDGSGGTTTLGDAISTGGAFQLKNGTFDTNNKACTFTSMALSQAGFGVRQFNCGSSLITLTAAGTVFTVSGDTTDLTWNPGASTVSVTSTGTTALAGGGLPFYNLTLAGGGGGQFTLSDSTAITNRFQVNSGPYTVKIGNAATITLGPSGFSAIGTAGNTIKVQSTTVGGQAFISSPANDVICNYLDVQDVTATGGARWFAGKNSVNSGNNNGWRFTDRYRSPVMNTLGFAA